MKLTHFDEGGNAHMVDVSQKDHTERVAVAEGFITLSEEAFSIVASGNVKKGDVLAVAQLAAIMGAKQTSNLIPLCHPLALTKVSVDCSLVEMEALTAVQVGLLTVYDMVKAVDKTMTIGPVYLVEKQGGKSGHFKR